MMKIAQRAQRIEPFYVMEVAKAAAERAALIAHTDAPMIFLNIGEPDFTAPPLRPSPRRSRIGHCPGNAPLPSLP
jgi:hypothetical protein